MQKINDLEELLFIKRFGLPKRKATFLEIRNNNFKNLPAPVFFLSTGRTGTNWFISLLKTNKEIKVFHEPKPNLGLQGVLAYNYLKQFDYKLNQDIKKLLIEIFLVSREQYLRYSYKTQKRYVETNNQITFFAPLIAELFPNAKFVHLYRHPGDFVRSAMRRNFYIDGNILDIKRISPIENTSEYSNWKKFSQIQKQSWLWNETNNFIEKFKKHVGINRCFSFNFNRLNLENVVDVLKFLNIDIPKKKIISKIGKKTNIQDSGNFPLYENWKDSDKQQLREICGYLSKKYSYSL